MSIANADSSRASLKRKLVLDDQGAFVVSAAEELVAGELEGWIRRHLRGADDTIPYGSPRAEEAPSDAVVDLYRAVRTPRFRIEFAEALRSLARAYLNAANEPPEFIEFLRIVERTGSDGPFDELYAVAREGRLKGRAVKRMRDGEEEDLHRRVLFALGSIAKQIAPFWEEEINSPQYAEAAFFGLCRLNPQRALLLVPKYARICVEHQSSSKPPRLGPPLAYLIEQKQIGLTRAANLLRGALVHDDAARELVDKVLQQFGGVSLDDAASANAVAEDCVSYVLGRGDAVLFNALRAVRSAETEPPPLAFEEHFTLYSRYWVAFPTLDCTSLALHCMRVASRLTRWLEDHRERVMQFFLDCLQDGFSISPARPASLYATLNAIGVLKALAGLPQQRPLCDDGDLRADSKSWAMMVEAIGEPLLRRVEESSLAFLRSCVGAAGLPVDCPRDPARATPSVHSLDYAVGILWNYGRAKKAEDLLGIKKSTVLKFLAAAQRRTDTGLGFLSRPESPHQEPCTTTTAMVLRLCERSECIFDFDKPAITSFLRAMQTKDGGFRVFPSEQPTLSATSFSISALRQLGVDWKSAIDVEGVQEFTKGCWRHGGYAFNPHPFYPPNVHSTRQALRIYYAIDPVKYETVPESTAAPLAEFLDSLFDRDSGGFFGYPRKLATYD